MAAVDIKRLWNIDGQEFWLRRKEYERLLAAIQKGYLQYDCRFDSLWTHWHSYCGARGLVAGAVYGWPTAKWVVLEVRLPKRVDDESWARFEAFARDLLGPRPKRARHVKRGVHAWNPYLGVSGVGREVAVDMLLKLMDEARRLYA